MIAEQFEIDNGRNSQIDRIYLLPTVPRRILRRAMSMQKPLERKVAWSLIRICRSSGHRNRWRLHFQSRLFDCNSVSRSSTTEQLRGSLISFFYLSSCTVTFATCISLRKHAFSRTLFGSANTEPVDWTFYLFFSFFFPFSLFSFVPAFSVSSPFAFECSIRVARVTKIKQRSCSQYFLTGVAI